MKHYGPHDLDEFLQDEDLMSCDVCDKQVHEDEINFSTVPGCETYFCDECAA